MQPGTLNNAGALHGGIVPALLDVSCYLALLPYLPEEENVVTDDVTASLMRPARPGAATAPVASGSETIG